MSDLTTDLALAGQAFKGQISWETVAAKVESQAQAILKNDPTATAFVGTAMATVKQGLSTAISDGSTYLGANQGRIASATETALETEMAVLTKGMSIPLDGFVSDGIDKLVAAAVTAAQAYGLQAKAALAANPATPPVTITGVTNLPPA